MYRSETDADRDRVNLILDKLLPKPAPSRSALERRGSDGPLRGLEDSRTRQGVATGESRRVSDIMDQITSLKMQQDDFVVKQMRMDLHQQRLDNEIVAHPVHKTRRWREGQGIFKETKDMVVSAADDKFNSSVTLSTENSSGVSSDGWESGGLIPREVERVDLEHKIHGEC